MNLYLHLNELSEFCERPWEVYDKIGVCKSYLQFMALLQARKQEIIEGYQVHETDTGSADVQVAMLTDRISKLSDHLKINKKDHSSRRGLLKMIGQRKRLLAYINKRDAVHYRELIKRLGIRG